MCVKFFRDITKKLNASLLRILKVTLRKAISGKNRGRYHVNDFRELIALFRLQEHSLLCNCPSIYIKAKMANFVKAFFVCSVPSVASPLA